MKTIRAWAVVNKETGDIERSWSNALFVYFKKKDVSILSWSRGYRIVRVEIREVESND